MMKYKITICIAACLVCLVCYAQKKTKVGYEFPDAMKPNIREGYSKECDKGQILYEINCGKCHNTVVKKKELIPDFTPDQIRGYEIRVSNKEHEANMPDELVTEEELGLIATFLTFKKKSGLPMVPKAASTTATASVQAH